MRRRRRSRRRRRWRRRRRARFRRRPRVLRRTGVWRRPGVWRGVRVRRRSGTRRWARRRRSLARAEDDRPAGDRHSVDLRLRGVRQQERTGRGAGPSGRSFACRCPRWDRYIERALVDDRASGRLRRPSRRPTPLSWIGCFGLNPRIRIRRLQRRSGLALGLRATGRGSDRNRRLGKRPANTRRRRNRRTGGKRGECAGAQKQRPASGGGPPDLRFKRCQVTASFPDRRELTPVRA